MQERFRLGPVVARSFRIWLRELPLLLAIALVVHAPRVALVETLRLAAPAPPRFDREGPDREHVDAFTDRVHRWLWRAVPFDLAVSLVQKVLASFTTALVIFAVYARLRGQEPSYGESIRGGLRRVLPVLRVSLCIFVLSAALAVGALLLGWTLFLANVVVLSLLLGWPMRLLIALLLSPFWVAVPAAVVERPRGLLRRSFRLTRGHRVAVCAVVLLLFAVDWGTSRLLRIGLGSAHLPRLARSSLWWAQELLMVLLAAIFAAVGYRALRVEKEGVDVSELTQVFE